MSVSFTGAYRSVDSDLCEAELLLAPLPGLLLVPLTWNRGSSAMPAYPSSRMARWQLPQTRWQIGSRLRPGSPNRDGTCPPGPRSRWRTTQGATTASSPRAANSLSPSGRTRPSEMAGRSPSTRRVARAELHRRGVVVRPRDADDRGAAGSRRRNAVDRAVRESGPATGTTSSPRARATRIPCTTCSHSRTSEA